MEKLTKKQSKTVKFIKEFIDENSCSPTYKEIAEHFKVNVNAVQQSVSALIKKGSLEKVSGIARGLRLKDAMPEELSRVKSNLIVIPLYGNVAAGEPVFAENNIEGYIAVEKPKRAKGELFSVTVRGDSMIDKKIVELDKLIIRKQETANDGEIVVALLDDEVTVKVFKNSGGKPYLQPANNRYDPIRRPFKILGIVVGLVRDYTLH
jgi:repressor LexA